MKHNNIHTIGVLEGEEREQGIKNLFEEIVKENFPNLVKEKDTQVQESQRFPKKMNPKRPTPRHIIIKMVKVKGKESSKLKRKTVTYKGAPIKQSADF